MEKTNFIEPIFSVIPLVGNDILATSYGGEDSEGELIPAEENEQN